MRETLADRNLRIAITFAEYFTRNGVEMFLGVGQAHENGERIVDVLSACEPEQIKEALTELLLQMDDAEVTRHHLAPGLEDIEPR